MSTLCDNLLNNQIDWSSKCIIILSLIIFAYMLSHNVDIDIRDICLQLCNGHNYVCIIGQVNTNGSRIWD